MKSLKETILEGLQENNIVLNEAFESDIMRKLVGENKNLFKELLSYNASKLKWDKIQDSDITEVDTETAKKTLNKLDRESKKQNFTLDGTKYSTDNTMVFWMRGTDLLGVSSGKDVKVTRKSWLAGNSSGYRSVVSVSKDATHVYLIQPKDLENFSTTELRNDRWASKKDALAFKTNWEVLEDNKARYRQKVAEMKAKNAWDADLEKLAKQLKFVLDAQNNFMQSLALTGNWIKIQYNNEKISKIVKTFGELGKLGKEMNDSDKSLYAFQYNEIKTLVKEVEKSIEKAKKLNDEMLG